jgi:hypothetical protein
MRTSFAVALEDLTGVKTFICFGANTPVKDICTVIDEEVEANKGMRLCGMSLLRATNEKMLMEAYSKWKAHFDE